MDQHTQLTNLVFFPLPCTLATRAAAGLLQQTDSDEAAFRVPADAFRPTKSGSTSRRPPQEYPRLARAIPPNGEHWKLHDLEK